MSESIRVGIVGASADGGWAREGHVPAVRGLAGFELVAVATNSRRTADAAARAFGVSAYASGLELIRDPNVDVVTVATRVQDHRDLVLEALAAGKHVYCEWPLGRNVAEAEEMAAAARAAGVHTAIGVQLRGNPVVRSARSLIASGRIGRLLSMNVRSATAGFGREVPAPFVYLEDPANFANLVTIQGAHTIDLSIALGGGFANLGALATRQYPRIVVDGTPRERVTFDHLLVQSGFANGATASIETSGARPPTTPFVLEATGETGTIRLDGGAARGFQSGRLRLSLDGEHLDVDEGDLASLPDAALNVAGVYAMLGRDIRDGSSTVTGFDHAVRLTRLTTDVLTSSSEGRRIAAAAWPES